MAREQEASAGPHQPCSTGGERVEQGELEGVVRHAGGRARVGRVGIGQEGDPPVAADVVLLAAVGEEERRAAEQGDDGCAREVQGGLTRLEGPDTT